MCRAENGLSRKSRALNERERGLGNFTLITSVSERETRQTTRREFRERGFKNVTVRGGGRLSEGGEIYLKR